MWVPLAIQLAPILVGALGPLIAALAQRIAPQQEPDRMVVWLAGSGAAGAVALATGGDPTLALVGGATIAEIVERMRKGDAQ